MEPLARILADAAGPKSWGDTPPTPFKLEMPFQYQQIRNGLDQVVCIEFLKSVTLFPFFTFLSSLCPPSAFIGSLKLKCPIVTSSLPSDILCKWNQAIFDTNQLINPLCNHLDKTCQVFQLRLLLCYSNLEFGGKNDIHIKSYRSLSNSTNISFCNILASSVYFDQYCNKLDKKLEWMGYSSTSLLFIAVCRIKIFHTELTVQLFL